MDGVLDMRNDKLLKSHFNKTFEEILWMDKTEFRKWCVEFRKFVVDLWDNEDLPPIVGNSTEEIISDFNKLANIDRKTINDMVVMDELTNEKNVIRNTYHFGSSCNNYFPTMMKTKINYSAKNDGKSIYDFFAKDELLETFITYATRHFKRDSFYHYSTPINTDAEWFTGREWILGYSSMGIEHSYDYWLNPVKDNKKYTGYDDKLRKKIPLLLTRKDIEELSSLSFIPDRCKTNVDWSKSELYQIRKFKHGQKVFPIGLKAFRVSFCQYAVNFPPLTAKYLYERFTDHIKDQEVINIYDPSAGWGGRILGAMAVSDDRNIHYIGTDPNTDHNLPNGKTKYDDLATFFNRETNRGSGLFPHTNTFEIFQDGSEVIKDSPKFQKYKGKIDLVFTSPPYFAKEAYSEDPEQSCNKFGTYETWRDGFLRPTLETACEYLKSNRYLLWNIADAKFGSDMLPLEGDSNKILESLGMEYCGKLKMGLAQMPGANRMEDTGETYEEETTDLYGTSTETKPVLTGKMKNFCKVNGIWLKYEPIFIWRKK
jgi:hypothetical protein